MKLCVYRIGDICKIKSGKRLPAGYDFSVDPTEYRYIRSRDIKAGKISLEEVAYIDEETKKKINKYIINEGDIAITIVANIGDIGYATQECDGINLTENAVRLTEFDNNVAFSKYLAYYLCQPSMKSYMENLAAGAAQAKLGIYKIEKMKVQLPEIGVQKAVVEIVDKYDHLIEVNNKRIKVLEQMAENLYKEWFVRFRFPGHESAEFLDGIPKGWEYLTIESLSDVLQRGISPDYDGDGNFTVISQKCIRQNIMDIKEARRQNKAFKPELNLQDGDTVICSTGTGTLGRVGQVYGEYHGTTFDSHVTLVRSNASIGKHFLFWTLKEMQPWFMNMGIGSTNQQELYRSTIKNAKALTPGRNIVEIFENVVEPIHSEIIRLMNAVDNLTKQRDLLLPRLMSGKLEV